jgi:hypothetical protein
MITKFIVLLTTCFLSTYAAYSSSNEKGYVVDRSGTFTCEEVDNIYMSFEKGLVEVGKDRPQPDPIEINYFWGTKNDDERLRPSYERKFAEVKTNLVQTISSYVLGYSTTDYAFNLTDDKFEVVRRGLSIYLKRTYKEDWMGFITSNFLLDEASVFNSALKCKRTVTKE